MNCMVHSTPMQKSTGKRFVAEPALILKEGENVSPRSFSTYLAPYHITANNIVYNGYKWNMAHYLDPIAAEHFLVTSSGGDLDSSPIYQNPGWPMTGGGTPQ